MNKQEIKKWRNYRNIGDGILKFGSVGFIGSVLSPFDFEGPIIELITAIVAIVGFILKKTGESHLEDIEGTSAAWNETDRKELTDIKNTIEETTKKRKEKKK